MVVPSIVDDPHPYHPLIGSLPIPLLIGNDLLGVLVAGAITPLSEKVRNVLLAVASSFSAMLSNARSYQHIHMQADELARQRDKLARVNADLEEANRMRSQFISIMSHELRTPLTSILGFSQILLKDSEKTGWNQYQRNDIQRIVKNDKHLLALVNDVLYQPAI